MQDKPFNKNKHLALALAVAILQALLAPVQRCKPLLRHRRGSASFCAFVATSIVASPTSLLPSLQASVVLLRDIASLRTIDQPWRMKTPFDTT